MKNMNTVLFGGMKKHGGPWIEILKEIPVSVPGHWGTPRGGHGAGNLPTQLHTQSHQWTGIHSWMGWGNCWSEVALFSVILHHGGFRSPTFCTF